MTNTLRTILFFACSSFSLLASDSQLFLNENRFNLNIGSDFRTAPLFSSPFNISEALLKTKWKLLCNVATSDASDALIIPAGSEVTLTPDPLLKRFVRVRWNSYELIIPPSTIE